MSHILPKGYEEAGFFGRNCESCLRHEEGTPYEAACRFAKRFVGATVWEEDDGWTVCVPVVRSKEGDELPSEVPQAVRTWLDTPIKEHIARWKSEIQRGLRDKDGKWIGPNRR